MTKEIKKYFSDKRFSNETYASIWYNIKDSKYKTLNVKDQNTYICHRKSGPSRISLTSKKLEWFYKSKEHRIDGPAYIDIYHTCWYYNGFTYKEQKYWNL